MSIRYEARGKIIGQRMLDIEGLKTETSVSCDGTMKSGNGRIIVPVSEDRHKQTTNQILSGKVND